MRLRDHGIQKNGSDHKTYDKSSATRKRSSSVDETKKIGFAIEEMATHFPGNLAGGVTLAGSSWPNTYDSRLYRDLPVKPFGVDSRERRYRQLKASKPKLPQWAQKRIAGQAPGCLLDCLQAFKELRIPLAWVDADKCAPLRPHDWRALVAEMDAAYTPELGLLYMTTLDCGDPFTGKNAMQDRKKETTFDQTMGRIETAIQHISERVGSRAKLVFQDFYRDSKHGMLRVAIYIPPKRVKPDESLNWEYWMSRPAWRSIWVKKAMNQVEKQ